MSTPLATRLARVPSWAITVGLAAVAGLVLLRGLDVPERIFFDETYYVEDARGYLDLLVEPSFAVHPPLGKWLIAAGIALVGDTPVGWRLPGALAGVLLVVVVHRLGERLLADVRHGPLLALAAPLLLLFDGVFLVQARTAMLDIFLALFVGLAVWLVVVDRDERRLDGDVFPPPGGGRFRWLAGVALGAAIAVKWSGLLGLGVAGLLVLIWELALRRRVTGRWWAGLGRLVVGIGVPLVLVPAAVYAVTWIPWGAGYEASSSADCEEASGPDCTFTLADRAVGVWDHQDAMLGFHLGLEAEHPYRSAPISWPVLQRPVVYYYESCSADRAAGAPVTDDETGEVSTPDPCIVEQGEAGEIILVGNPVTWWLFLAATPLLVTGVVRRDRRSLVALVGWAGQFLPWLIVSRAAFLFYMVPVVAFQALGLVVAATQLRQRGAVLWPYVCAVLGGVAGFGLGRAAAIATDATTLTPVALVAGFGWFAGAALGAVVGRLEPQEADTGETTEPSRFRTERLVPAATGAMLLVSLALFVYFLPVWVGEPLPREAVSQRWWFDSWV